MSANTYVRVASLAVIAIAFVWTIRSVRKEVDLPLPDRAEMEHSGALQALNFWTDSRSYPDQDISQSKYFTAFQQVSRQFKNFDRSTQALNRWISIGPSNVTGRAISIAVNPLNPATIYIGSASGGLWRTYTGGAGGDWHRIVTGYPVLGVGAIAIDPTDTGVVYIGTGEVYRYQGAVGGTVIRTTRGSYGMGILKTTDAGATWSKSLDWSYDQQRGIQRIVMNPLNPHSVWAATTEGVYKSTDAGSTWVNLDSHFMAMDLVIHSGDTNRVLVSSGNFLVDHYLLRTDDGGATWANYAFTQFTGKMLLETIPGNPNSVYASVADSTTGNASLWKTTDFGINWNQLNNTMPVGVQGWYSHFVAVHPTDSMKVIHATTQIGRATDGGINISFVNSPSTDYHSYAHHPTDPNTLYIVSDGGLFKTTDFGVTFVPENLNGGLVLAQFYNGSSNSMTDSNMAIGAMQDNGAPIRTAGTIWDAGYGIAESGWKIIDPSNDSIVYSAISGPTVYKSTDRGANNNPSGSFPSFPSWNEPCILSPSQPAHLYLGATNIYHTTNAGSTWSDQGPLDGNPALSMAISRTNPDTVFVGTAPIFSVPHVFRTTNGGALWTDVTGILPNRYFTDITVDPYDSRKVYVTMGGFGSGHLFRSSDAGTNWTNITGNLPDIPTGAVMVHPYQPDYIFVGNDLGVFVSTNAGSSWLAFNEGLPEAVIVSDLMYSPANNMIRVATHGNGMYEHVLPGLLPTLTVDSPNGGESWEATSTHDIGWRGDLLSAVKIEYSLNDGGTWTTLAENIPAAAPAYSWIIPKTLTTLGRIRTTSVGGPAAIDVSDSPFTIYFTGILTPVHSLWNLISLPVLSPDPRISTIFPTEPSSAFAYEGSYVPKDTMVNGTGYWFRFAADDLAPYKGDSLLADTIQLNNGWNLIGTVGIPLAVTSLQTIPPGIVTSRIFGFEGHYTFADTLAPGLGYWIRSDSSCQLVLSNSPVIEPSARIHIVDKGELPPPPPGEESVADLRLRPTNFELTQNYPNPFNPTTEISYSLRDAGYVSLKIVDIRGREVATLVDQTQTAGRYTFKWDAENQPSGIYFYRLAAGSFTGVGKMLLIR